MNAKYRHFSDKRKLREFIARRPALQEMLKEVLHAEGKWYEIVGSWKNNKKDEKR